MLQNYEQPVEIADRVRHPTIATHDGGRLRRELRQHLRDLNNANQVAGLGRPRFQRLGIEHLHAAGAGIEVHVVAAVMNGFLSLAAVQVEVRWGRCQALAHQGLGKARHPVIARNSDFNSRRLQ